MTPSIYVATANDSTDPQEFGGTPAHLLEALATLGHDAQGIDLRGSLHALHRTAWAIRRVLLGRRPRGWQYSEAAQRRRDTNWARRAVPPIHLVSLFQLPPIPAAHTPVTFYIDATLNQVFETYPETASVPSDIRASALIRERLAYSRAQRIFVKTRAAESSLINHYGISPSAVEILPPSPNLEATDVTPKPLPREIGTDACPLRLLLIGKDFHRKGVDRAIYLTRRLNKFGVRTHCDIVGISLADAPPHYRDSDVRYWGFQEKGPSTTMTDLLSECHIGLLLSRAEMAGLALVEYQAAGLVTYCSGVGGMEDLLLTDAAFAFEMADDDIGPLTSAIQVAVRSTSIYSLMEIARTQRERIPSWTQQAGTLASAFAVGDAP